MVPKDSGNIWLGQLWQWQCWVETSVWGETHRPCAPFPVKLVGIKPGHGTPIPTQELTPLRLSASHP